jgi:hypothetical protein
LRLPDDPVLGGVGVGAQRCGHWAYVLDTRWRVVFVTDQLASMGPTEALPVGIGRIITGGRSEVTALGDEVNETARIEACATGGRTLASKSLLERLNRADAETLGVDPHRTTNTLLADLPRPPRRPAATRTQSQSPTSSRSSPPFGVVAHQDRCENSRSHAFSPAGSDIAASSVRRVGTQIRSCSERAAPDLQFGRSSLDANHVLSPASEHRIGRGEGRWSRLVP